MKVDKRTTRPQWRKLTEQEAAWKEESDQEIVKMTWGGADPFPDARSYKCHGCDRQAHVMHHQSYHPDDHRCVVPLCGSCHQRTHWGSLQLTFGVVPTAVGLVRIAIVGGTESVHANSIATQ